MESHGDDRPSGNSTTRWGLILAFALLTAWIGGLAVELSPLLPDATRSQLTASAIADWCAAVTYDSASCSVPVVPRSDTASQ